MSFQLRNYYQYKWEVIEQQGDITFELSDAACFYESFKSTDLGLQDWIAHFKRRKKPYVLAKGEGANDPNTHWCLFTTPLGPDCNRRADGIRGTSETKSYTLHLPELM